MYSIDFSPQALDGISKLNKVISDRVLKKIEGKEIILKSFVNNLT